LLALSILWLTILPGDRPGAQEAGPSFSPEELFDRFDQDGNRRVTTAEVSEPELLFAERFDSDSDGTVTESEINVAVKDAISAQSQRDSTGYSDRGPKAIFERSAPKVGDPLPELLAYDSQGEEFPLSSLRGSYAVLVFGCLT